MLGVDVSKEMLTTSFVDLGSFDPLWTTTVPNTREGIAQVLGKTPASVALVVEPTGRYSHLVVREAQAAGRAVYLAPPRKAHYFRKCEQDRAKTDPIDSASLARFGHSTKLRLYTLKSQLVDDLGQLLSARRGLSDALSRLKQRQVDLPQARALYAPVIAQMSAQLALADKQIQVQLAQTPAQKTADLLADVPGIGPVTASAVAACLVAKGFDNPDQFVAYVGLDIAVRQSGRYKTQVKLTRQGDAELRRLLYLCAKASVRTKDSPYKDQFERERKKGLKPVGAYCAIARKMARLCWSLHKHGSRYDAARVGKSPNEQRAAAQKAAEQEQREAASE